MNLIHIAIRIADDVADKPEWKEQGENIFIGAFSQALGKILKKANSPFDGKDHEILIGHIEDFFDGAELMTGTPIFLSLSQGWDDERDVEIDEWDEFIYLAYEYDGNTEIVSQISMNELMIDWGVVKARKIAEQLKESISSEYRQILEKDMRGISRVDESIRQKMRQRLVDKYSN